MFISPTSCTVRDARLSLSFDDTFGVDDVAPVPTPLSCHPLKASEGLEALAAICVTVTPR